MPITVICGAIQARNYYSWGNEFAQGREWNYEESLDWFLLDENHGGLWHKGVLQLVKDLNGIYQKNAPLFELDGEPEGFDWLVVDDAENSVFAFERKSTDGERIIVISNLHTCATRRLSHWGQYSR